MERVMEMYFTADNAYFFQKNPKTKKQQNKHEEHWEKEELTVHLFPGQKLMEIFILQL